LYLSAAALTGVTGVNQMKESQGIQSRAGYISATPVGIQSRADNSIDRTSGNKNNELIKRSVERDSDDLVNHDEEV
jgi:hypothetical protein